MHRLFPKFVGNPGAVGLLALRLVAGAAMMFHGWPKVQNPTGWMGDAPVPGVLQAASAVAEFGGGLSWFLGALTPLFSLLLVGNMAFATFMVHVRMGHPFIGPPSLPSGESAETAVLYLAIALLFLLAGPGIYSVDNYLFKKPQSPPGGPAVEERISP
jgi:putative oxidoreductase